jgi:hypothetical protein
MTDISFGFLAGTTSIGNALYRQKQKVRIVYFTTKDKKETKASRFHHQERSPKRTPKG